MTLRLRCIRCGDWDDMDPTDLGGGHGLCGPCWDTRPPWNAWASSYIRWCARWQNGMDRHPTYKTISAALDAMGSTPHVALDSPPP